MFAGMYAAGKISKRSETQSDKRHESLEKEDRRKNVTPDRKRALLMVDLHKTRQIKKGVS